MDPVSIIIIVLIVLVAAITCVVWACISVCKACISLCGKLCGSTGNERTETQQRSRRTQADVTEIQSTSEAITPSVRPDELELQFGWLPLQPTAPNVPIDIHVPTIQPRPRTASDSVDPVESESLLPTPTTGEPPPAYYTVFMAEHKQLPPEPLPFAEENTRSPSDTD